MIYFYFLLDNGDDRYNPAENNIAIVVLEWKLGASAWLIVFGLLYNCKTTWAQVITRLDQPHGLYLLLVYH